MVFQFYNKEEGEPDTIKELKTELKESLNPNTDCMTCRVFSCAFLAGAGFFLLHNRHLYGKVYKVITTILGGSCFVVGYWRAVGHYPFDVRTSREPLGYYDPTEFLPKSKEN